jgi:uncharacterized protein
VCAGSDQEDAKSQGLRLCERRAKASSPIMSTQFPVAVADLDIAGKEYSFALRPEWIRGALEDHEATTDGKDGSIEVRLSKSGTDIVVHGRLKAGLKPTPVAIDKTVSVIYVPQKQLKTKGGKGEEVEFSPEDADVLPYDGESLALDDLIREELVLETPMIPLCSEDCPGMYPTPATKGPEVPEEPAIDPRLLPLLQFKKSGKS